MVPQRTGPLPRRCKCSSWWALPSAPPVHLQCLLRQRDHAAERNHTRLVTVYEGLLERLEKPDGEPSPGYAGEVPT